MKKLGVILLVTLVIVGLAACGSSGKPVTSSAGPGVRYVVDLDKLTVVSLGPGSSIGEPTGQTVWNTTPFTKNYDDLMILLPEFPADMDWSLYNRVTIGANVYDENRDLIPPANGNAMVTLVYDPTGDIRGPGSEGPSNNIPLKTFNVGGSSSNIDKDRGSIAIFDEAPRAMLFQNSNTNVKFIEVTALVFHDGSAAGPASKTFTEVNLAPLSLILGDNFDYGDSWLTQFRPYNLLNNYAVQSGDQFTLTVTYTASRDLSNPVQFSFVNIVSDWDSLSREAEVPASKAGEEVSATLNIRVTAAGGPGAEGNTLIIQTAGRPSEGKVILNFSEFNLKKTR